ncbi:MAG: hypothetical protein EOP58_00005 [Sphingomonadales bacterium]|nr:MAG: hypothetical protein EOP58_00005 [Sphingomonadales bacterium]
MRAYVALASALLLSACDGGGSGGGGVVTPTPTPTPAPANTAPTITSATTANFAENATGVAYQTTATDAQGDAITYTLSGTDAARFTLSAAGALSFVAAPDFEAPGDANADNVYEVTIRAADAGGNSQIALRLTVTNIADQLNVRQIASFAERPVQVVPLPGSTRILVAEFGGKILIGDTQGQAADFVDYTQLDVGPVFYNAQSAPFATGLSGVALAPDYATSRKLYVAATNAAGNWEIRRYSSRATGAPDLASEDVILRFPAGFPRLRGGWIAFGPDGYLYVTTANIDRSFDAASLTSPAGKVLRIDVNSDAYPADPNKDYAIPADNPHAATAGALPEIFASGLSRPSRASFDGANLIIGDAQDGLSQPQRVYLVRPQDAGKQFGTGAGQIAPVIQFSLTNDLGNPTYTTLVGGIVYRGNIPSLTGKYLFAEYYSRKFWAVPAASLVPGTTLSPSSFESINSIVVPTTPAFDARPVSFSAGSNGSLIVVFQTSAYMLEYR